MLERKLIFDDFIILTLPNASNAESKNVIIPSPKKNNPIVELISSIKLCMKINIPAVVNATPHSRYR